MNQFAVEVQRSRIKKYEKKAILLENTDFLIPMNFIELGEKERILYDYSGFTPICGLTHCLTVRDVFDFVEDVIKILRISAEFLIFPERLHLTKETVYVDSMRKKTKLLFLPPEQDVKPLEELLQFINDLQTLYLTKEAMEYAELLKEYICANLALPELQSKVIMMKRDALLCGIH